MQKLTCSPSFVKKVITDYKFEEIQHLRVEVYDADTEGDATGLDLSKQDFLGDAEMDIPDLVHSLNAYSKELKRKGKTSGAVLVKCEELNNSSGNVIFKVRGNNVPSKCFLRFSNIQMIPIFCSDCFKLLVCCVVIGMFLDGNVKLTE